MYGTPIATVSAGPAGGVLITQEVKERVAALLDMVSACGTMEDMHNLVVPEIQRANVPGVYHEQLVRVVNAQLDIWHAKLPVGKLRMLLFPPALQPQGLDTDAPEWLQKHCYVTDGDFFFDNENAARLSPQGFIAQYARFMPAKLTGGRENPVEWAFTRWNITTVHHLGYRPDKPQYFQWDGFDYANLYSPATIPAVEAFTEEGIAGIAALQATMWDMCGRREDVFYQLLWWFAHNVQHPGVKIRWSPVIKGCPGDAKTILSNVLRAAMGYRNVGVTGNNTLHASGGFDDWKVGSAVNCIEEIYLAGKERFQLYNAMKDCITNDVLGVNAKGGKTYKTWNITNHFALTNHNNAIPLEKNDRRWFTIFTPWYSLPDMYAYCGMTEAQWQARTKAIDRAWKNHGGELRNWFLSIPIGTAFDPDGSAMMTPEKQQMIASSQDDAESVAESIISDGARGITNNVILSSCLSNLLRLKAARDGIDFPKTTQLNHMLTRLGYSKLPKQTKIMGATHTVWVKNGFMGDIKQELETGEPADLSTLNLLSH
jgi:Family of unknown function (DUF5906)